MEKVKANLIIEIMGRPPEHIKEALNTLVIKMGSEKGVNILDKKYHEPKPVKETKNLFTAFAEVNVEFDSLEIFFTIIMIYMPSNVEVYEPERFKLNAAEINSLGNHLVSKLHRYEEITKRALMERNILLQQLEYLKRGGKLEDLIKLGKNNVKTNKTKTKKSTKKASSVKKGKR